MDKKIFYLLIEEDVQNVAQQTLGRRLNSKEIFSLKDAVADKINWFEAVESAIVERFSSNQDTN